MVEDDFYSLKIFVVFIVIYEDFFIRILIKIVLKFKYLYINYNYIVIVLNKN